jgi:hypothetical protein
LLIGLLFTVYLCFCSAYNGASFYHKRHTIPSTIVDYLSTIGISQLLIEGYSYFELVYIGGIIIAIVTALTQMIDVYKIVFKNNESILKPILGKLIILINSIIIKLIYIIDLLPFLIFFPSCIYYCKYSDIAFNKYPLLTMLLLCSIHVEGINIIILQYIYILIESFIGVVNMMLMHILKGNYLPFQRYGHFYMLLFPILVNLKNNNITIINEELVLIVSTLVIFISTARMLIILYMEVMTNSLSPYNHTNTNII